MTSHRRSIAQSIFGAAILRSSGGATSVSQAQLNEFHASLDKTVTKCTATNVKECVQWLHANVVSTPSRIEAFAKYIVFLSNSIEPGAEIKKRSKGNSSKRKQLHLLYVLNDLLHNAKYHWKNDTEIQLVASHLRLHLESLFASAASFEKSKCRKHLMRLSSLLDIWSRSGYYDEQFIQMLRDTVENSSTMAEVKGRLEVTDVTKPNAFFAPKQVPYMMPAMHGDSSKPYYELPAGNMVPHISEWADPVNLRLMKALQFSSGRPFHVLEDAARESLEEVGEMKKRNKKVAADPDKDWEEGEPDFGARFDAMGHPLVKDGTTGKLVPRESYYGWSMEYVKTTKAAKEDMDRGPSPDTLARVAMYRDREPSRERSRESYRQRTRSRSPSRSRRAPDSRSLTRSASRSRSNERRRPKRRTSRSPSPRRSPPRHRFSSTDQSMVSQPPLHYQFPQQQGMPWLPPPPPPPMGMAYGQWPNFQLPPPPPPPSVGNHYGGRQNHGPGNGQHGRGGRGWGRGQQRGGRRGWGGRGGRYSGQ